MTAHAILVGARERLARPGAWLHGSIHSAAPAEGDPCDPCDLRATRWDLVGALMAAGWYLGDPASDAALHSLVQAAVPHLRRTSPWLMSMLAVWHEAPERTLADVLAVLDAAIAQHAETLSDGEPLREGGAC